MIIIREKTDLGSKHAWLFVSCKKQGIIMEGKEWEFVMHGLQQDADISKLTHVHQLKCIQANRQKITIPIK
jgi:hypothetical protein